MKVPHSLVILALLAPLGLAGCGGGGARSETAIQNTTVSRGQALIDLKAAYDKGALSAGEYEKQRQLILQGS